MNFDQLNRNGTRAKCPSDAPAECVQSEKNDYCISVNQDFAHCHRCKKNWFTEDDTIVSDEVKLRIRTKMFERLDESGYDDARVRFLDHYEQIFKEMRLPWNENALDYDVGIRRDKDQKLQLVFKITEDHVKYHKGIQFGDAECKVFPILNSQNTRTLLLCEGEKDAITANCNGVPAITFTSGAGALPKNLAVLDKYKDIVICFDNDNAGRDGALKVAKALYKKDRVVKIIKWGSEYPNQYDLTDYFADGHSASDLMTLMDSAQVFGADELGAAKVFTADDFLARDLPPVQYICDEILLESGTTGISGMSNVGKSVLALQLGVSIAMGVPFMGQFVIQKPRKVLFVQFEMLDQMMQERLDKQMRYLVEEYPTCREYLNKNFKIASFDEHKLFSDAYVTIEKNLMTGDYDVLVIDNLYTSSDIAMDKNDKLQELLSRITELKLRYKIAMVMVSHHKKMAEKQPLDHFMVYGGSTYVNWLDNLVQVANTGKHKDLKVFKITKTRTASDYHDVALGIKFDGTKDTLALKYIKPLPKNESFWYLDSEESPETRLLDAIETDGDNFSRSQFAEALNSEMNLSSNNAVSNWIDKLEDQGLIGKLRHGEYFIKRTEIDDFL